MVRKHISNHRQSVAAARQQQQFNRLQHYRWQREQRPSWPLATAIALLLLIVVGGQFG